MRNSLRRTTLVLAVLFCITAMSLPGCSTSNAFKMPSMDWLSWGKKPSSPALASKPTNNLPAPPSSLASPNTVPSYAQGSGTAGGNYGANPYSGPASGGVSATPASYGGQPSSASGYPASAYGAAPGAAQAAAGPSAASYGSPAASYGSSAAPYGSPAASQGFYSPDYRGSASTAGSPSVYASQPGLASPPPTSGGDAYGAYGPGGYGGASQPGPSAAPYGATANAYAQPAAPGAPGSYAPDGDARANSGYATDGGAYGSSVYGDARASASPLPPAQQAPATIAGGSYRPGSTARSTQFGTSDQLNVPGESVQPASFAGGGQGGSSSSLSAPGPVGGTGSYPYGDASPTRTATGAETGVPYPGTYQR